jgi:hypothetical protein
VTNARGIDTPGGVARRHAEMAVETRIGFGRRGLLLLLVEFAEIFREKIFQPDIGIAADRIGVEIGEVNDFAGVSEDVERACMAAESVDVPDGVDVWLVASDEAEDRGLNTTACAVGLERSQGLRKINKVQRQHADFGLGDGPGRHALKQDVLAVGADGVVDVLAGLRGEVREIDAIDAVLRDLSRDHEVVVDADGDEIGVWIRFAGFGEMILGHFRNAGGDRRCGAGIILGWALPDRTKRKYDASGDEQNCCTEFYLIVPPLCNG